MLSLTSRRAIALVTGLVLLAYFTGTPLLQRMGRYLIEEDPPARADAIVVLAGSVPDRILEAVELYKEGYAPRIIISRGRNPPGFAQLESMGVRIPRLHELNRSVAEQLGVPPDAILEVGGVAGSTYDEAELILLYVREHGYRTLLLVTSKHHSRRAALIFRQLAGAGIRVISRPSRYDNFQPDRWWTDRQFRRRVIIEYQKILVFQLVDRWRVTPVAARLVGSAAP